ncbi:MAG: DUF308 domain-containing protein [Desulfobacterales bacterium]|nr:DUF308 domain-containing protein [Desulfobacterales bacterium]
MTNSTTGDILRSDDVVDRAQRADGRRWCAGDRLSRGGRRGRRRHVRMAADGQRRPASRVCLEGGPRRRRHLGDPARDAMHGGGGFYLLARPVAGLESLTLALAVYLVMESVLEFILAFQLRPAPGSGWLLFDGIVTLALCGDDLGRSGPSRARSVSCRHARRRRHAPGAASRG